MPDGTTGEYFYGETRGHAMVIPVADDGRLILVMHHRYLADKLGVEFPSGGLLENEQPNEAASRELLEETGYKTSNFIKIGTFESLTGLFKDPTHLFVAPELSKVNEPTTDDTEKLEVIYRRPDEFDQMIVRGEVWDGQTLAAWALAKDFLFKSLNVETTTT